MAFLKGKFIFMSSDYGLKEIKIFSKSFFKYAIIYVFILIIISE